MNPLSQRGARGVLQAESSVREGAWQANAPSVDSFHWTSNGKRWGPTTAFFHAIGFPISSRLVGRLSAHLQICQVTIHILQLLALSLDFCFVWAMLFFFFFFPRKSSLFQLFFCSDLENRARHWCLGDWVVFFWRRGLCILYDVIYSPGDGTLGKNIPMPGYVLSMIWGWKWYENIWVLALFLSIPEAAIVTHWAIRIFKVLLHNFIFA